FPVPPLPGQELPPVPRRTPRRERELIVSGGSDTVSDGSTDGKEASDG
ncbi:NADH-quinone oxidoreductase subunit NuoH, partial [Streptomyces sp. 900105755]